MTTLVKRINPNFPSFFGRDFDVLFNEALPKNDYNSLPAVNVLENEDNFKIEVAAPGFLARQTDAGFGWRSECRL